MKFINVTIALALALTSDSAFATKDDYDPFFSHQDVLEETTSTTSKEGKRYMVQYKRTSSQYKANLKTARIQAQAKKQQGGKSPSGGSSISADSDTHDLLTDGRFLPKQNVEIVYFSSETEKALFEKRDDVELIEEDHKIYLNAETIPYGIDTVQALAVSDDYVSNRKVCIIDSGYDITHPDLTSDTDVVTGFNGSTGLSPWTYDGNGHGTHVAGTIAAIGSNDQGVVGVNRNGNLKLHIVKAFRDDGDWAWESTLIAAVEECVNANANVINMSFGRFGFSQTSSDTYDRILNDDNILLVAAAGNGGNTAYSYPASYNSVMSVAATDSDDNVAYFSQQNDQVDIAAPGVGVLSTLPNGAYAKASGTSMACPHVAGIAALIWSHHTTKSAVEIRQALEHSAIDLGATGRDDIYGHGLVRADLALDFLNNGFTPDPTQSPTPRPSCTDNPEGWYDGDGPDYNCEWYATDSNCATYGDFYPNNGKTANMACCACGGGRTVKNPTASPSFGPTVSPSRNPTASPTPLEGEGVATCGYTGFIGSNSCPFDKETIDYTTLRHVRCCSDTDLGQPWTKNNQCSVWAATIDINDGCSGKLNFSGAMAYCTDAGGRLCTSEELANDCTRFTGCGYDKNMIWSSSPPEEVEQGVATCGYTGFLGSNSCPSQKETIDYTTLRHVRCCSDTDLGQPWTKNKQCSVWAATKDINDGCSGKLNFSGAMAYCADAGGRLCTSEELANDCTRKTGCGYDKNMIWSSTAEL